MEINGDAPCSYPDTISVDVGDYVTLEAVPSAGYHFTEWSGEPTLDNDNPLEIKIVSNIEISANFAPDFIEFISEDGLLNLVIPDGTTALDEEDEPLSSVDFVTDEDPPLPDEATIIGHAYELEPDGATFDPPVTLSWNYEPSYIPEGVAEEYLVIAYYDEDAEEWVALDSEVNPEDTVIITLVDHLTTFAILAPAAPTAEASFTISNLSISPAEANPGDEVTISALITNHGQIAGSQDVVLKINGATADTINDVNLNANAFTLVTFSVVKNEVGTYLVDLNGFTGEFTVKEAVSTTTPSPSPSPSTTTPPSSSTPSPGINWRVMAPILTAVFLGIFLPIRLKRRREGLDW